MPLVRSVRRWSLVFALLVTTLVHTLGVQSVTARTTDPDPYPTPAESPELRATDCLYAEDDIPESLADAEITCGYVTVPQDHANPDDGNTIELYVVQIAATGKNPSSIPLVMLSGGPGQASTDFVFPFGEERADDPIASWNPILQDHDIVLVDQRGTGHTLPEVLCPVDRDPEHASFDTLEGAYGDCAAALADEDIDLNTYNTRQSAADMDAVRQALGAERIDLIGISYGTWLALEIMRNYPSTVRSVILDSPMTPQANWLGGRLVGFQDSLDAVYEGCAEDPKCDKAYPDLEEMLTDAVADLNDNPPTLTIEDPNTGEEIQGTVTGTDLLDLVYQLVFIGPYVPFIAPLVGSVAEEDYTLFEQLLPIMLEEDGNFSTVLHLAIICQDELAFTTLEETEEYVEDAGVSDMILDSQLDDIESRYELCAEWDLEPGSEWANEPTESTIPTLILTGRFDPITPTAYGEDLLDHLPNAVLVESPIAAHDPLSTSGTCGVDIATAFLKAPRVEVDTSCFDGQQINFSPSDHEERDDG